MTFLEDPRLRQRWNQIAHDAEAATENAAAGIWSFQHHYINPCLGSVLASIESCTTLCLGDAEERLRKRRERARESAEYSFDFYDDWYEEEGQSGGLLGGWGSEDWDRLLAGTGSQRRHNPTAAESSEQPRRKRGMSYGTRGGRRKPNAQNDPTIIPSTQPIGFLSKLPWKMGGTLRYKPSAADLQEHPGMHEQEPLLGSESSSDMDQVIVPRKRSGTTGSGDTSDSWRSRGDLFPSDGEGDEDAVPLDDDVTYDMIRKDDRSSGKSRRSSKGKGRDFGSRTVSRTSLISTASKESHRLASKSSSYLPPATDAENGPSLEDFDAEEDRIRQDEDEKIARQKEAATQLAAQKRLKIESPGANLEESKWQVAEDENYQAKNPPLVMSERKELDDQPSDTEPDISGDSTRPSEKDAFVPARLPYFG